MVAQNVKNSPVDGVEDLMQNYPNLRIAMELTETKIQREEINCKFNELVEQQYVKKKRK